MSSTLAGETESVSPDPGSQHHRPQGVCPPLAVARKRLADMEHGRAKPSPNGRPRS